MFNWSKSYVSAILIAGACVAVFGLPACAQSSEAAVVRRHVTVNNADLEAAKNIRSASYHVLPANTEGAKQRAATLNLEGSRAAREAFLRKHAGATGLSTAAGTLASPYFYPADLTSQAGAPTLGTVVNHAVYVNMPSGTTIAQDWGNPEQFLKDLNLSTFIHLTDQYTGKTANGRYPDGASAKVTYNYFGNVLYEHEIYAIVHAAAVSLNKTGMGHIYHVFLPSGTDTCFDLSGACYSPDNYATWAFCAYHSAVSFSDIGLVLFSVEPYQNVAGCAVATPSPNGQLADSTNSVLSHELFEAITDPIPGASWINRSSLDMDGYEIGDECQPLVNASADFLVPTFLINGKKYEVQLEYSNTYHACAAQP